jgi:hypothetical protein
MIEDVVDGDERNEGSIGYVVQPSEPTRIVAAIEHAGGEPDGPRRGFLQSEQKHAKPLGMDTRRGQDNKVESFNMIQKIR